MWYPSISTLSPPRNRSESLWKINASHLWLSAGEDIFVHVSVEELYFQQMFIWPPLPAAILKLIPGIAAFWHHTFLTTSNWYRTGLFLPIRNRLRLCPRWWLWAFWELMALVVLAATLHDLAPRWKTPHYLAILQIPCYWHECVIFHSILSFLSTYDVNPYWRCITLRIQIMAVLCVSDAYCVCHHYPCNITDYSYRLEENDLHTKMWSTQVLRVSCKG